MKQSMTVFLAGLTLMAAFSTQAETIKNQPLCATQAHQVLMKKVGAQTPQATYQLVGIVRDSNFMEKGSHCALRIDITESADGEGLINIQEVRTNLMFPFGHFVTSTRNGKVCKDMSLTAKSVERQDSGWRKTLHTTLKLSPQNNGQLVISYSQKEGRVFPSGDELTCVF